MDFIKGCDDDRVGHTNFSFSHDCQNLTENEVEEKQATKDIAELEEYIQPQKVHSISTANVAADD